MVSDKTRFFKKAVHISDMSKEEAYGLIQDCVEEVQKRLIVNLPNFQVKVIDRDGITTMPDISIKTIV